MLALQRRLHISFAVALGLVALTGAISFYYLHLLDRDLRSHMRRSIVAVESGDLIRASFQQAIVSIQTCEKNPAPDVVAKLQGELKIFDRALGKAKSVALTQENIERYDRAIAAAQNFGGALFKIGDDMSETRRYLHDHSDAFIDGLRSELGTIFQSRFQEFSRHQEEVELALSRTQRNLILLLLLVIIGGLLLAFVTPMRVVWPFKRLFAAFREAEGGNLSVRLPAQSEEEVGEISRAFNRLMAQMEDLDEKKVKRIMFEHRRFETLANLMDAAVILVNVEGELVFLNAPAYRVFGLHSDQVMGKKFSKIPLPDELKELLEDAIKHKHRIEDREWSFHPVGDGKGKSVTATLDVFPISTHTGDIVNMLVVLEERSLPEDKRLFRRMATEATHKEEEWH